MRMIWNSKLGKSNVLEYSGCTFLLYNKYEYVDDYTLFMDCLLTNISDDSKLIKIHIPVYDQVKKNIVRNTNKKKLNIGNNFNDINNNINHNKKIISIETIKQYLDLIDPEMADDYNDWIKIGMCIHNCNPTNDGFLLWDRWSRLSESFDSQNVNYWKWSTFNQNNKINKLGIGTLKYYAKEHDQESYNLLKHQSIKTQDCLKFNPITIEQNYLLSLNEIIKEKEYSVTKIFAIGSIHRITD